VGILLLVVSFLYNKFTKSIFDDAKSQSWGELFFNVCDGFRMIKTSGRRWVLPAVFVSSEL
jgi:hypothetical protein